MFADHFGPDFHGYVPFANAEVTTDAWRCVPAAETDIPPDTKHGAVLPLRVSEYEWLAGTQFPSWKTFATTEPVDEHRHHRPLEPANPNTYPFLEQISSHRRAQV
ncbi:hypothetical protein ACIHFD_18065 [Nonomuraea sp. NPDC051941]|uniref:hypothetical protein n=1 Tax=Nonomuraea sp. NPDC051941 TaxID=3364373 RepID=UPI0037C7F334